MNEGLTLDGLPTLAKSGSMGMVYFLPWQDRRAVTLLEDDGASSLTPEIEMCTQTLPHRWFLT